MLYHRRLGRTPEMNTGPDPLLLSPDAAGSDWLLDVGVSSSGPDTGFNGWIHDGRLVPLVPVDGRAADQAW